ncbi:hypothetical protein N658DRAFT_246799 [Parathielavia hyrcaniae]|uniref:Uncharacterized protein n=1 Tax=Parathielavia hyrcaniae TaxID=113614 RepID=A0AAN6T3X4_9PEZI|nr:hypothetical protein N658DRAFT_246799 [Parathielavia hyrcaniae]
MDGDHRCSRHPACGREDTGSPQLQFVHARVQTETSGTGGVVHEAGPWRNAGLSCVTIVGPADQGTAETGRPTTLDTGAVVRVRNKPKTTFRAQKRGMVSSGGGVQGAVVASSCEICGRCEPTQTLEEVVTQSLGELDESQSRRDSPHGQRGRSLS